MLGSFSLPIWWRRLLCVPLFFLILVILLQRGVIFTPGAIFIPHLDVPESEGDELNPQHRAVPEKNLTFWGLSVEGLDTKGIAVKYLEPANGYFFSRRTVAVMGGSGSGKSTLLEGLLGRRKGATVGGRVLGGFLAQASELKFDVSFVPQSDDVHAELTVRENLWVSAALRHGVGSAAARAAGVLTQLGFTAEDAGKRVGFGSSDLGMRISGGQKKRVNIGVELVAGRSALWLDEPTSGLDSSISHELVELLREYAAAGASVVAVVHSPSAATFALFDDLALFAPGGFLVYFGPREGAVPYFSALGWGAAWATAAANGTTEADWLIDVAKGRVEPDAGPLGNDCSLIIHRIFDMWTTECKAAGSCGGGGGRGWEGGGRGGVSGGRSKGKGAPVCPARENFCAPLAAALSTARAAPGPARALVGRALRAAMLPARNFLPLMWRSARLLSWGPGLLISAFLGAIIGFLWWYLAPPEATKSPGLPQLASFVGSAAAVAATFSAGIPALQLLGVEQGSRVLQRERADGTSGVALLLSKLVAGSALAVGTQGVFLVALVAMWALWQSGGCTVKGHGRRAIPAALPSKWLDLEVLAQWFVRGAGRDLLIVLLANAAVAQGMVLWLGYLFEQTQLQTLGFVFFIIAIIVGDVFQGAEPWPNGWVIVGNVSALRHVKRALMVLARGKLGELGSPDDQAAAMQENLAPTLDSYVSVLLMEAVLLHVMAWGAQQESWEIQCVVVACFVYLWLWREAFCLPRCSACKNAPCTCPPAVPVALDISEGAAATAVTAHAVAAALTDAEPSAEVAVAQLGAEPITEEAVTQLSAEASAEGAEAHFFAEVTAVQLGAEPETQPADALLLHATAATLSSGHRAALSAKLDHEDRGVLALAVVEGAGLMSGGPSYIRVWSSGASRGLVSFEGGACGFAALPNGMFAAATGRTKFVEVWDAGTGQRLHQLSGHDGDVCCVAALPGGLLASGSHDKTVRIWNADHGGTFSVILDDSTSRLLEGHTDKVQALAVFPDGQLASGSMDNTIRLWNVATRACTRVIKHPGSVLALAILEDTRLASGSDDSNVYIWSADIGVQEPAVVLRGHTHCVRSLAALPNGLLTSGGDDKTVCLWDVGAGKTLTPLLAVLRGHEGPVIALAALPDGRLASGSEHDSQIFVWKFSYNDNKVALIQWTPHGGNNQLFRLEAPKGVEDGWSLLRIKQSGKVVDMCGGYIFPGRYKHGLHLHQWQEHREENQQFKFEEKEGGWGLLRIKGAEKVVDVHDISVNDGAPLCQWAEDGARSQLFKFEPQPCGWSVLRIKHSNKVMDLSMNTSCKLQAAPEEVPPGPVLALWEFMGETFLVNNGNRWKLSPHTFKVFGFREGNIVKVGRTTLEAVSLSSELGYHGDKEHKFWLYRAGDALPHPEWDTHDAAAFCSLRVREGTEDGWKNGFRCLGHPGLPQNLIHGEG